MPIRPKKSNIRTTGRIVTAIVLLTMLAMVGWTAWFLYGALNSSATADSTTLSPAAAGAETLNAELLDKIEKNTIVKVSRPIPSPQDVRNPFILQVPAPAAPAAEPPPTETPPTETPPPSTPAAP